MTRIVLLATLIVSLFLKQVSAQELYFGINGGKLRSQKSIQTNTTLPAWMRDSIPWEPFHSYTFGLHAGYRLNQHWSVESGLQFGNEGYKDTRYFFVEHFSGNIVSMSIVYFDWYHNFHYMRVPLMAQYSIFPSDTRLGVLVFAGPNLGFLVKQDSRVTSEDPDIQQYFAAIALQDEPVRKTDIGFQGGLRLQVRLTNIFRIFADGSYYHGGKNILKDPKQYYEYDYKNIRNRHFSFNLGLQLSFH